MVKSASLKSSSPYYNRFQFWFADKKTWIVRTPGLSHSVEIMPLEYWTFAPYINQPWLCTGKNWNTCVWKAPSLKTKTMVQARSSNVDKCPKAFVSFGLLARLWLLPLLPPSTQSMHLHTSYPTKSQPCGIWVFNQRVQLLLFDVAEIVAATRLGKGKDRVRWLFTAVINQKVDFWFWL
jgi:hypothetical protein